MLLKQFAQINPKVELARNEEYPFVEMQDIAPGYRYVINAKKRVFKGGGSRFQNGDVLFARITPCLENGKIAQYENHIERDAFGSTELIIMRNREGVSDPSFLYYLVLSDIVRKPAEKSMFGASGRQRVDVDVLSDLKVPSYTLDIQHGIAGTLTPLDDLMQVNLRRIKVLERISQAMYDDLLAYWRFPGCKKAEKAPTPQESTWTGWETKKLGELADEIRIGISPRDMNPSKPYVGLAHIPQKSIGLLEWGEIGETVSTKLLFRKGDILFGKIRPYLHKVVVAPVDGACSSDTIIIRPKMKDYYSLVLCCVSSDAFVAFADKTSKGTQMPRTDWKILQDYDIPYPPSALLNQFNSLVTQNVELMCNLILQNKVLARARNLLLLKLVSGEVNVIGLNPSRGD